MYMCMHVSTYVYVCVWVRIHQRICNVVHAPACIPVDLHVHPHIHLRFLLFLSSSSSSFSSGDNKTTLAHFRAQQQNMAAFAAGMHARLGARSRVLGLNEQVVILLVLVMLACMHACMHTDLIRTKRVRATHTVNTHIFVIQMR